MIPRFWILLQPYYHEVGGNDLESLSQDTLKFTFPVVLNDTGKLTTKKIT